MNMDAPDPTITAEVPFLREVTLEGRELFDELRDSGFTDKQATTIVAHFIVDAVNSRDEEFVEVLFELSDDDEDDLYDERDDG